MRLLFQDYETFYGQVPIPGTGGLTKKGKPKKPKMLNLSLKNNKINYTDYVRHPEFEVLGVSLKWEDAPVPRFYRGEEIEEAYAKIDWKDTKIVAHNAMFEGIVNYERYRVIPGAYFCTMACAEALFQGATQVGLGNLAKLFGIGEKLNELHNFKGLHAKDLTPEQWAALAAYCNQDIALTQPLYKILAPQLSTNEQIIMNHTLMMWANPVLKIDAGMAREALAEAEKDRDDLVAKTGLTMKEIGSDMTFAAALKGKLGWIPQKYNKNGELKAAFAKTDQEFVKLKINPDESVRNLVLARLEVKSSQNITRAARLIKIAETGSQMLPVGLHYARAHTMRWTGGNKINLQNLERGGKLRRSILAPPGYVILVVDSSQIECRTLASIAGQEDLVQMFRDGEDPYNHMAILVFSGGPYDKKSDERFMGKTMVLGLGYGMGYKKFHREITTGARGKALPITIDFAHRAVGIYRDANQKICGSPINGNEYDRAGGFWQYSDEMIKYLVHGKEPREFMDGMVTLHPVAGKVVFPNGNYLRYPDIKKGDDGEFVYRTQKKGKYIWKKIYGGLYTENMCQAIARHIVADQCRRIAERYRWVLSTHDEGGFLVREEEAEEALAFAIREFRTNLSWTNIPLDAEGGYDVSYSK